VPKNVIVVGAARSGTSLTASVFVRKGYFVASDHANQLQVANERNISGYWEFEELIEANVKILNAVGFPHHNTWTFDEISPEQTEAIFSVEHLEEHKDLVTHFERNQPWIMKDPRFCYTLGYWWPLMNPETTRVLIVTRNPHEIRQSLLRARWGDVSSSDKQDFIRRIEDHLAFARRTINRLDIPYMELDYGEYSSNPKDVAKKLGSYFGFELTEADLGYQNKYNSSSFPGYLRFLIERLVAMLPASVRRLLNRAVPDSIIRILFPTRAGR